MTTVVATPAPTSPITDWTPLRVLLETPTCRLRRPAHARRGRDGHVRAGPVRVQLRLLPAGALSEPRLPPRPRGADLCSPPPSCPPHPIPGRCCR